MNLTALQTSLQTLQGFAVPGAFVREGFLAAATNYQNTLETLKVPAGYLTPVLDLFSDPRSGLDFTAAQAFLEHVEASGFIARTDGDIAALRERASRPGRFALDSHATSALRTDPSHADEIVPTFRALRPLSGLSLDDAPEVSLALDRIGRGQIMLKEYRDFRHREGMPLGGILNELRFQSRPPVDLIVKVHQAGLARSDHPYLALEWTGGGSLSDAIDHNHVVPSAAFFQSALLLMSQMVEAVAWTHQHGILHRDLEASNFFLSQDRRKVKLGGFGLAIREEESGFYEQRSGTANSYAQDVLSLGKTISLFLKPGQNAEVDAVIARATHASPGERYPSAVAMMEDIERIL